MESVSGFQLGKICDSLPPVIRRKGTVMGRAYSQDLASGDGDDGSGTGAYASVSIFRVSVSYIYKLLGRRKRTGETTRALGQAVPSRSLPHMTKLCAPAS